MPHTSPATYLTWTILCVSLGAFLVFHLWNFDRFKCLKWNHGPYSGAFKRIMTYTYLVTIPLIAAYAMGFSVIKYKMGYTIVPGVGVIPTPFQLWPQKYQDATFPFQLLFSIGWSLEMVTHLEELCFWLFLVNAGSVQQDWFRSLYFKTWMVGSVIALAYMPIVTSVTRSNPLRCEAWSFLAGSLGDLILTLWFTPILWTFPKFVNSLKKEGVDMSTIVRLTTFYELNTIRVVCRFLFVVPLLILAVDGIRPHQHINDSSFWTEFLLIISGIGCVVSSGITLVIFFPRSIQSEVAAKEVSKELKAQSQHMRTFRTTHISEDRGSNYHPSLHMQQTSAYDPRKTSNPESPTSRTSLKPNAIDEYELEEQKEPVKTVMTFSPNRRIDGGKTTEGGVTVIKLTEDNLALHDRRATSVHPFVHNFTSPIDVLDGHGAGEYEPRGGRTKPTTTATRIFNP
ncbi:hypothetical protein ABKN59_007241 [Abortiporus biennis]